MKAAVIDNGAVRVADVPEPVPAKGQALVRTHSCGICASEQHFLHSGQNVIDLSRRFGGPYAGLDYSRPFVPGHEYVGEVLDYGPGSERTVKPGRRVVSLPVMRQQGAHTVIGFSHECPGGWGELMLLDEATLIEVPSELDDDMAAMTEPLAVSLLLDADAISVDRCPLANGQSDDLHGRLPLTGGITNAKAELRVRHGSSMPDRHNDS